MEYSELLEEARVAMGGKLCRACEVCNGRACRNMIPGPGAKGVGDNAVRNYDAWRHWRVNMDTICELKPVDMSLELLGHRFKYPFFAAPVGAVRPDTVGQFTGLYDCDGKEIFEGDILRFGNSPSGVCEVKWNESIAAFCIRFYFDGEIGSRPLGGCVEFAIIGNIHDNPELLKQ